MLFLLFPYSPEASKLVYEMIKKNLSGDYVIESNVNTINKNKIKRYFYYFHIPLKLESWCMK